MWPFTRISRYLEFFTPYCCFSSFFNEISIYQSNIFYFELVNALLYPIHLTSIFKFPYLNHKNIENDIFKSYAKFKQLKAIVFEWAVKICRLGTTWYKSVLYVTCCQTFLLLVSYKSKDVYSVRYRTISGVSADGSTIADRMGS